MWYLDNLNILLQNSIYKRAHHSSGPAFSGTRSISVRYLLYTILIFMSYSLYRPALFHYFFHSLSYIGDWDWQIQKYNCKSCLFCIYTFCINSITQMVYVVCVNYSISICINLIDTAPWEGNMVYVYVLVFSGVFHEYWYSDGWVSSQTKVFNLQIYINWVYFDQIILKRTQIEQNWVFFFFFF